MELDWIKRRLEELKPQGKTQAGLAKALGIEPSGVSRMLKGERQIKARELATIYAYLGVGDASARPPEDGISVTVPEPDTYGEPLEIRPADVEVPAAASLRRDVPVYGTAVGGDDAEFLWNGETIDYVRRPPGLVGVKEAFAIYVSGSSMSPRYEEGELVYIHPKRPARPGDDVVIELHGKDGQAGKCFLKRFIRRAPDLVHAEQFFPVRGPVTYPTREVRNIYKVLTNAELLGL